MSHNHHEANGLIFEFNFELKCNTDMGSQITPAPEASCMKQIK